MKQLFLIVLPLSVACKNVRNSTGLLSEPTAAQEVWRLPNDCPAGTNCIDKEFTTVFFESSRYTSLKENEFIAPNNALSCKFVDPKNICIQLFHRRIREDMETLSTHLQIRNHPCGTEFHQSATSKTWTFNVKRPRSSGYDERQRDVVTFAHFGIDGKYDSGALLCSQNARGCLIRTFSERVTLDENGNLLDINIQ